MVKFVKVVSSDGRSLTVEADNGQTYTLHGNVAWRANNPGNLRPGSLTNNLGAIGTIDTGSNGKFLVFPDRQTGDAARSTLLFETPTYANKTLLQAIQKYAPTGDNNNPAAYAASLASAAGVDVNTKVSDLTPAQRQAVMTAQIRVEDNTPGTIKGAEGVPVDPAVVRQFSGVPLPSVGIGPLESSAARGAGAAVTDPFAALSPAAMNGVSRLTPGTKTPIPAMDTEASVSASGPGSLTDPGSANLLHPATPFVSEDHPNSNTPLARAFARLSQATGKAVTQPVAPTPMPGRPAALNMQATSPPAQAAPQTIHIGEHDYQVGQTFDQGGTHYVVTPNGITSSRIPTGEPTVVSGVIGQIVKDQVAPQIGQALKTTGANVGNSLTAIGTGIGSKVQNFGDSLGSTIGNFLKPAAVKAAPAPKTTSTGPTQAQLQAMRAVPSGSYLTPTIKTNSPTPAQLSAINAVPGALSGSSLTHGAGAAAGVIKTPAPKPAAPTMTLAQYNARQQANAQALQQAAQAKVQAQVAAQTQAAAAQRQAQQQTAPGSNFLSARGVDTQGLNISQQANELNKQMSGSSRNADGSRGFGV